MYKIICSFIFSMCTYIICAQTIASGKCGEHVNWTLSSDSVLTITGSGPMQNYNYDITNSPYFCSFPEWFNLYSKIKSIVISEGVTTIGSEAFCYIGSNSKTKIQNIELANTIDSIGFQAFSNCPISHINLPDNIKYIDAYAFSNTDLESITLPGSLYNTGSNVFSGCFNLQNVIISEGVSEIGYDCFDTCESLWSVTLPNSLKTIKNLAFANCSSLTFINIPENVNNISSTSFSNCESLTEFKVDSNNNTYTSIDGVIYNKDCSKLIIFPSGKTNYTIPSSVIEIKPGAFTGCNSLYSINVEKENMNFASCNGILYSKDFNTLIACPGGLKYVSVLNGTTTIGESAFYGNQNLKEVYLPETINMLNPKSFYECRNLEQINLPDNIQDIPMDCFNNNNSLTNINIPKSVKTLGTRCITYAKLNNLNLPEGLTTIYYGAFDCSISTIDSIIIPSTCKFIDDFVFNQGYNVQYIKCLALDPPSIKAHTFNQCGGNGFGDYECSIPVYVPEESIDKYKNAQYWQDMNLITFTTPTSITNIISNNKDNTQIYNIDGKCVNTMTTGIYIKNKKKFFSHK